MDHHTESTFRTGRTLAPACPPPQPADTQITGAQSLIETLRARPEEPEDWLRLGELFFEQRQLAQALSCFGNAVRHGIDPDRCAERRWMCWMLLGEFERAWEESDEVLRRRRERGHQTDLDRLGQPGGDHALWDGTPLAGRDVLLRCRHGLGDTIQYIRYAPCLRRLARSLTVEAQSELIPLLRSIRSEDGTPGIDRFIPLWSGQSEPAGHTQIECTELPYIFRSTLATLPATTPYLWVAPDQLQAARQELDALAPVMAGQARVGLVWAAAAWSPARSLPLAACAPLATVPGVRLIALQGGAEAAEARTCPEVRLIWPASRHNRIEGLAALMHALDLVITVDTMAAHLAGALGRPVWTLLQAAADWRWLHSRDDSPWYPTMRLFRQPRAGDWAAVVHQVAKELALFTITSRG